MDTYEGRNGEPLSLHKFLYANGNPVMGMDPSGRTTTVAELNVAAALLGTMAVLAVPATAPHISAVGEAMSGLAGEIGESALGGAQRAASMAAVMIALEYDSLHDQIERAIRDLAEEIKELLRRTKVVPISHSLMPEIAQHVEDAQRSRPSVLNRVGSFQALLNRREAIRGKGAAGSGLSWDEYPFASTRQGGTGSSLRRVPLGENLRQGGIIGASYLIQGISVGDAFFVAVIP